nr:hypothetical protein [Tanacetum cinerariifolium]
MIILNSRLPGMFQILTLLPLVDVCACLVPYREILGDMIAQKGFHRTTRRLFEPLDETEREIHWQRKAARRHPPNESLNIDGRNLFNEGARAFWSLNEDILKIIDSDYQYAVSIKENIAYPCLHSPKTIKERSSIHRDSFYTLVSSMISGGFVAKDKELEGGIAGRKLGAKGDIGLFICYSANSCTYRVYNQRTKEIMETMNVTFDEILAKAFKQCSLKPELQRMTSGHISSGLDLTYAPSTITSQKPTEPELDLLFKAMYDDYIGGQPSVATRTAPAALALQVHDMCRGRIQEDLKLKQRNN